MRYCTGNAASVCFIIILVAPSNCAFPGCSTSYKNEKNGYMKQIMSSKFLKKNLPEYEHQESLQKFLLQ